MSKDITYKEFLDDLSSSAPTPGGGGASALCGAVGAALGNMVASLTIGKEAYADVWEDMERLKNHCMSLQNELISLIDKDAEMFLPLMESYRLPAKSTAEKEYRSEQIESALEGACEVPLEIMEKCARAMDCIEIFAMKGSKNAISDAGAGAIICKAALQAASLNVFINTKSMKDRSNAQTYNAKARELLYIYGEKGDNIYNYVMNKLK